MNTAYKRIEERVRNSEETWNKFVKRYIDKYPCVTEKIVSDYLDNLVRNKEDESLVNDWEEFVKDEVEKELSAYNEYMFNMMKEMDED